jgi:nucleoid-associated protein YgaU
VGRETKFGLLVGVVFIVLFGVILSSRAGSASNDHAAMPMGANGAHAQMARSTGRNMEPFTSDASLSLKAGTPPVDPAPAVQVDHRPMQKPEVLPQPTPEELAAALTPVQAPKPEPGAQITFGAPALVATPTDSGHLGLRGQGELAIGDRTIGTASSSAVAPAALNLTVHVVKPGETLISIAKKYAAKDVEVTWQKILDANRTVLRDEKHLAVGQKLVIPVPQPRKAPATDAPATTPAPAAPETPRKDPVPALFGETVIVHGKTAPTGTVVTPGDLRRMLKLPAEAVDVPAEMPALAGSTYTIQAGDTFRKIAEKKYGDSKYGKQLAAKNQAAVPDERRMKVGMTIQLLDEVVTAPAPATEVLADARPRAH